MQVLIVTTTRSPTRVVEERLRALGHEPVRLETDRIGEAVQTGLDERGVLTLREGGQVRRLDRLGAVWYRRMSLSAGLPPDADPAVVQGVLDEKRSHLLGVLAALPCFVLDPKHVIDDANVRPRQLSLAAACGLDVPRALTTTDAAQARAFCAALDFKVITKVYTSFAITEDGGEQVMFTTALGPEDVAAIDGLDLCPGTFQERVDKEREYRVTVVGDRVFTCSVRSADVAGAEVDWRRRGNDLESAWERDTLPEAAQAGLLALMRRLDLTYGAADFVRTPEGRCVFLEVNPAGEYLWMDARWDGAISRAIADRLAAACEGHAP